ncbi:hypothetical protein Taro_028831 [Colocasia esculenta]|uniref:Uncharacterized protein n=1 Tax=Colocasia esculenta TaxID=4460 RepID=A0A843VYF7_COLES|nr:hypothetical protein [Colocasia esculenta]
MASIGLNIATSDELRSASLRKADCRCAISSLIWLSTGQSICRQVQQCKRRSSNSNSKSNYDKRSRSSSSNSNNDSSNNSPTQGCKHNNSQRTRTRMRASGSKLRKNFGVALSERAPLRFLLTPLVGHEIDQDF